MAHQRISATWHQLLDVQRSMDIPENNEVARAGCMGTGDPQLVLIGATRNDRKYKGTLDLNEAFSNRFPVPIDWNYDREVEAQLCDSTRLLDFADQVRSLAEIRTPVSTNMLMEFERHVHRYNFAFAAGCLVRHFPTEERSAVARALEAESAGIATDLGVSLV
jgi:hypothetical protein